MNAAAMPTTAYTEVVQTSPVVLQAAKGRLYGGAVNGPLAAVARIGGQCRALWNLFLAETRDRYEAEGKFTFYGEMSARLKVLLKEDPRLIGCPQRAAQMTVQRLDRALRDCAKARGGARKGFPKFKRHSDRRDAFSFVGREVRLQPGRIRLPKIGWVRVRGLCLPEGADLKQVAVTQEPGGWHVSIQFEAAPKTYAMPTKPVVGVDAGLLALVTLSDTRKFEPPRLARRAEKRIRRLNRERDRRRKGSVNRRRTVERLARAHREVRNRRHDHMHKITRELVDDYQGFAVETLSLKGLARTPLAKSFADAGLGEFLRALRYKALWAGREWRELPRFQRSTGVCPDCGTTGPELSLSVRAWTCETCGAVHDRDVAAARITLDRAVGPALSEPAGAARRKRGTAAWIGDRAFAQSRSSGPPTNVVEVDHG